MMYKFKSLFYVCNFFSVFQVWTGKHELRKQEKETSSLAWANGKLELVPSWTKFLFNQVVYLYPWYEYLISSNYIYYLKHQWV